jgi:hypothetical protein
VRRCQRKLLPPASSAAWREQFGRSSTIPALLRRSPIAVPSPMVRHVDEALPPLVEVAWYVGVKRAVKRGDGGDHPVFRQQRLRGGIGADERPVAARALHQRLKALRSGRSGNSFGLSTLSSTPRSSNPVYRGFSVSDRLDLRSRRSRRRPFTSATGLCDRGVHRVRLDRRRRHHSRFL